MNHIFLKIAFHKMLYSLFGDFGEDAESQKRARFGGKPLDEFLRSDYDYFRGPNVKGGGFSSRDPRDLFVDSLTGQGPRSQFFAPLRNAGIDTQDYQFYADKAGITNVNSMNDLDQIITAFEADRRQPQQMAQSMSQEMVPPPMQQQTMAGKYLGFF